MNMTAESDMFARLSAGFDAALDRLESAPPFARPNHLGRFLDQARRLLATPGGTAHAYAHAPRFRAAGAFTGSDWDHPETLKANLVPLTFDAPDAALVTLECLSELRMLAVVNGEHFEPLMAAEQATHFLTKVLALNLHHVFGISGESDRARGAARSDTLRHQMQFLADQLGYERVLEQVLDEIWRLLRQRPVQVDVVRVMVARVAECLVNPDIHLETTAWGAESLVAALFRPTEASREDPGVDAYRQRLEGMPARGLEEEARALARCMHDTGLVSPYHATFVRHALAANPDLLPIALGLSTTGADAFACYRALVTTLLDQCVYPETCQAILGMNALLERGILYQPGVAPSLWRHTKALLHEDVKSKIAAVCGAAHPPRVYLMMGLLNVLGQPLGLGQGNNPVCQSTRAISMWAYSDPDYLLQLVRWAARDNDVQMMFEGQMLQSSALPAPPHAAAAYHDLDPISLVLVPHLDKIYAEMGRLCAGRGDDPHRWINPEFHGWRVNRGFEIAVDIATGQPRDLGEFIGAFYSVYHPYYNDDTPVVHPQPAGIAVTDSQARYVGWHAITILRVALDHEGAMRVYFFNPNNDSGQDWGGGVTVSIHGHGEAPGESSLPVAQFASRLYCFHYDTFDYHENARDLPATEVEAAAAMAAESWVSGLNR
ncbi:MAG: hypothetical protein KF886_10590 [Candidatus Hydrogenedentes bacterium]|nr:hypothetical protein [Candidatus Hydrogenedentota bacterium]